MSAFLLGLEGARCEAGIDSSHLLTSRTGNVGDPGRPTWIRCPGRFGKELSACRKESRAGFLEEGEMWPGSQECHRGYPAKESHGQSLRAEGRRPEPGPRVPGTQDSHVPEALPQESQDLQGRPAEIQALDTLGLVPPPSLPCISAVARDPWRGVEDRQGVGKACGKGWDAGRKRRGVDSSRRFFPSFFFFPKKPTMAPPRPMHPLAVISP